MKIYVKILSKLSTKSKELFGSLMIYLLLHLLRIRGNENKQVSHFFARVIPKLQNKTVKRWFGRVRGPNDTSNYFFKIVSGQCNATFFLKYKNKQKQELGTLT